MEDMDFTALAARISAGLDDIRACLLLSADGLTLGAFPSTRWSGAVFVPEGKLQILGGTVCTCTVYADSFSVKEGPPR